MQVHRCNPTTHGIQLESSIHVPCYKKCHSPPIMTSIDSLCNMTFRTCSLKTGPHERNCRYHKMQGQEFSGDDLCPKGFCPHAFRIAYPYCLSLLYDSTYPSQSEPHPTRSIRIACPSSDQSVELTIGVRYTFPSMIRKLKNAAIRTLQFIGINGEYPDRDIILEVSRVTKTCPRGLTEGQSFLFNIWNRQELCPASFYSLYPILLKHVSLEPQSTYREDSLVHCPDPFGVYYHHRTGYNSWDCKDFLSRKADVIEERGKCPFGHREGDSFRLEDSVPQGFCLLAFYSIFPYYLTLIHSGRFEWVRRGEHVKVQCPKTDGVVMEIELVRQDALGQGTVRVTVINNKGSCPKGHNRGDSFEFDSQSQPFCFHAMAGLIPFNTNNREIYSCSGCDSTNHLLFKLG